MPVTERDIGGFIDTVAGKKRTPGAVAGRLLEETVELALAAGLTADRILAHVADALHNQALKASVVEARTVFPSQLVANPAELAEECADVGLVLKDLCHVASVDLSQEEIVKFEKFRQKQFKVTPQGTVYAVKPHIQ